MGQMRPLDDIRGTSGLRTTSGPSAHTRSDEAANPGGLDTPAGLDHSAVYFACTFFHTFTGEIGPSGVSTLLPVSVIVSP